ncbi:BspA family leucine-rich repeat surface protein [archaeon]|nr:MAG: BspA family leucine-rich repeat surface protein [archaeon]
MTSMSTLLVGVAVFNQPLGQWNGRKVTSMFGLFYEARTFNRPLGQ